MNTRGRYGEFGGMYVPEILIPCLDQLEAAFLEAVECADFDSELKKLLRDFAGRPTPLFEAKGFSDNPLARVFLKREDLVHGGAHKTNQALAQGLLAKRMGKTRLIAETGAGQHGVATAMVGALLGLEVIVYMGAKDVERQQPNVRRMQLMGATVKAVATGAGTLKYAINEALRDWATHYEHSHYLIGSAVGPHPFPQIVKHFQNVIGHETKQQIQDHLGKLPDTIIACVNGGSNALGIFNEFIADKSVALIGVESGGIGDKIGQHSATINHGQTAILHGAKSTCLVTETGDIAPTHSIAAGLDYPSIGPELSYLAQKGRVQFVKITDDEALAALSHCCKRLGIIPALESSHALAQGLKLAKQASKATTIVINLSGRGDKDLNQPCFKELGK